MSIVIGISSLYFVQVGTSAAFDVTMEDSQAEKRRLSFKDALLNKYSEDQSDEELLCFIHITGSPKQKSEFAEHKKFYLKVIRIDFHISP